MFPLTCVLTFKGQTRLSPPPRHMRDSKGDAHNCAATDDQQQGMLLSNANGGFYQF